VDEASAKERKERGKNNRERFILRKEIIRFRPELEDLIHEMRPDCATTERGGEEMREEEKNIYYYIIICIRFGCSVNSVRILYIIFLTKKISCSLADAELLARLLRSDVARAT
jgi:hypothetical protein